VANWLLAARGQRNRTTHTPDTTSSILMMKNAIRLPVAGRQVVSTKTIVIISLIITPRQKCKFPAHHHNDKISSTFASYYSYFHFCF